MNVVLMNGVPDVVVGTMERGVLLRETKKCLFRDKDGCDGVCVLPKGHKGWHTTVDLYNGSRHRFWWKGELHSHSVEKYQPEALCTGCGNRLFKSQHCLCLNSDKEKVIL